MCSAKVSKIGPEVSEVLKFIQGLPITGCQVFLPELLSNLQKNQLPENYRTDFYDIWTTNGDGTEAYSM